MTTCRDTATDTIPAPLPRKRSCWYPQPCAPIFRLYEVRGRTSTGPCRFLCPPQQAERTRKCNSPTRPQPGTSPLMLMRNGSPSFRTATGRSTTTTMPRPAVTTTLKPVSMRGRTMPTMMMRLSVCSKPKPQEARYCPCWRSSPRRSGM